MKGRFGKLKNAFFSFEKYMFRTFGFLGFWDYAKTVLGLSLIPFFSLQIFGSIGLGFITWFSDWVWNPPVGAALILSMTLINAFYGYQVNHKIKKEKFTFQKFQRTFAIMAADLLIMAIITTSIHLYNYYEPLADILFGWYMTNKLRQIIYHMSLLKLQSGGLSKFLKMAILNLVNSKIGDSIVDSLQQDKINTEKIIEQETLKDKSNESEQD
jgi:signal transduction histidine kinase